MGTSIETDDALITDKVNVYRGKAGQPFGGSSCPDEIDEVVDLRSGKLEMIQPRRASQREV